MPKFLRKLFGLNPQSATPTNTASNAPGAAVASPPSTLTSGAVPALPAPTASPTSARTSSQNAGPRPVVQLPPNPGLQTQQNTHSSIAHAPPPTTNPPSNQASSSQANAGRVQTNGSIQPQSTRQTTLRNLDFRKEARRNRHKQAGHTEHYSTYCLRWEVLRKWLSDNYDGYHFDENATRIPVSCKFRYCSGNPQS